MQIRKIAAIRLSIICSSRSVKLEVYGCVIGCFVPLGKVALVSDER